MLSAIGRTPAAKRFVTFAGMLLPGASFFMNKTTGLSNAQIAIMSITAGICVANIYYNQPILKDIAASFHAKEGEAGLIAVLSQAGYGLGLFFIIPLGDKTSRKKLILGLQVALIAVLIGMTLSRSLFTVYAMSLLIGLLAVAAQVILPMAAALSPANRGKTVGKIFTGILIGILAARVVSGYIAEWLGWRYVYGISAGMVLLTAGLSWFALPDVRAGFSGNYAELLKSTLFQVKRFAELRRAALLGALIFGAFCSFWTTLTFQLSGPAFQYRSNQIGLFGLLAIAGALMAPWFGKNADKGNPGGSRPLTVGMIIAAIVLVQLFPHSLYSFIAAVLLLDVGVQATQVTNIAIIYSLDETANSRINTVYMTTYFIGGALGTFVGVQCWRFGGWPMVCWQLLAWSLAALLVAWSGKKNIAAGDLK